MAKRGGGLPGRLPTMLKRGGLPGRLPTMVKGERDGR